MPLRRFVRTAYRAVRGGGDPSLLRRKKYHQARELVERQVLEEAAHNPDLFRRNECPACGGREAAVRFANPVGFRFAECAADGTVYMDPVPGDATLARLYNDGSYTEHWSHGSSSGAIDAKHLYAACSGGDLLDVGCANGSFLGLVKDRFRGFGVELNSATAEIARQRGFDVVTGRLADVPGTDRFDAVTMIQLIEHLPDPLDSLRDVRRLLKPGGVVYINTPAVDSASFRLLRERHTHVSSFGHVSLFNANSLRLIGERAGLTTVGLGHCHGMDLQLHDLIGRKLMPRKYRHRFGFYSQRFVAACDTLDMTTGGLLRKGLMPPGPETGIWAVMSKG